MNKLALLYRAKGELSKVGPLYTRGLAIREKSLSPDDPAIAASLYNLAVFYYQQGKASEAEQLLKRALKIREKVLGRYDPDIAATPLPARFAALHRPFSCAYAYNTCTA